MLRQWIEGGRKPGPGCVGQGAADNQRTIFGFGFSPFMIGPQIVPTRLIFFGWRFVNTGLHPLSKTACKEDIP